MKHENGIEVKGLYKSFGKVRVLKNINFSVKKGAIVALLGPNGAGKTTTINILSTLSKPDDGKAYIAGHEITGDPASVRTAVGLTGQFAAVDEYLTGRENLKMIGRLYHMKSGIEDRAEELIEQLELKDAADRTVKTYSGGMKRKIDLAMSLIASPPIIFLDEPTTGLDPRSRIGLWNIIKELAAQGKTILLTTQYMEEAEHLADNIVVIDHGKVIAEGTTQELKRKVGAERVEVILKKRADFDKALDLFDKKHTNANQTSLTLNIAAKRGGSAALRDAMEELDKAKINPASLALRQPTLDDVFLTLTGHQATEAEAKPKREKRIRK
jgi:ABC-2 type transport system ATP-binding protein